MTIFDYAIVVIIAISCLVSIIRGLLKEVFSLGAWVIAGFVTFTVSSRLSVLVPGVIESPTIRVAVTAFIVFILTLFLCGAINFLIHKAMAKVGLSGTDRLLGVMFGVVRGVVVVVVLVMLAGLTPIPQESWWRSSLMVGYFVPVAEWIQSYLPDDLARHISF